MSDLRPPDLHSQGLANRPETVNRPGPSAPVFPSVRATAPASPSTLNSLPLSNTPGAGPATSAHNPLPGTPARPVPGATASRDRFATLRKASRVWAISAVHGDVQRLRALHVQLKQAIKPGDRLVYLGNYLGWGQAVRETIDELLAFRCAFLARPQARACDIAYLRGAQEEMWQKLLQLQFAPNPPEVLGWMLDQGLKGTLSAYGGRPDDGFAASRDGAVAIARWTNRLRTAMHALPGHDALMSSLRRAAFTDDHTLLFVHAGLDPDQPLDRQGDVLWWGGGFGRIKAPYEPFRLVVRGFDRTHAGVQTTHFTATVDAGCGFGGPLLGACFDRGGRIVDLLEG